MTWSENLREVSLLCDKKSNYVLQTLWRLRLSPPPPPIPCIRVYMGKPSVKNKADTGVTFLAAMLQCARVQVLSLCSSQAWLFPMGTGRMFNPSEPSIHL